MRVQIVSRAGVEWEGDASSVVVPSQEGEVGILPGHTPMLALLAEGTVRVANDAETHEFKVAGNSFVTVDSDLIYIVVESATVAA